MLAVMLAMLMQPSVCKVIAADWIRGSDLANALPAFSALPPDLKISLSPLPGQTRIFHPAELRRLAIANHLKATAAGDVCFSWKLSPVTPDSFEAAMKATLAGRNPRIEILDRSLIPAPEGEIVFPWRGLGADSAAGAIWRGYVSYAGTRQFPIWARVRITINEKRVLAASVLHFGDTVQADGLRVEAYTGGLPREEPITGCLAGRGADHSARYTGRNSDLQFDARSSSRNTARRYRKRHRPVGGGNDRSARHSRTGWPPRRCDYAPKSAIGQDVPRKSAEEGCCRGCSRWILWAGRGGQVVNRLPISVCLLAIVPLLLADQKSSKKQVQNQKSPLDQYVEDAHRRASSMPSESPGSLWAPSGAPLADIAADVRARSVDDMVTIVVNEQASAVSTGVTKTSRTSSANAAITSAAGQLPAAGKLANLLNANSATSLNGQGTTSRQTTLTTTITARVIGVLPNGYLVIEGSKSVLVNSENQVVTISGVVRPADLSNGNTVQSGNVAQMELKVNGKGVVNDVIRRPNFLYRLLLGLLPF